MKILNSFRFLLIILFTSNYVSAQDSLSLFQNLKNQYDSERDFKVNIFYNPANMLDYSSSSFSELYVDYYNQKDKIYRQQNGSEKQGFGVITNSYQKLNKNKVLWGSASYQNLKTKRIKYNENLDFDRVAPYISSDSVGGDLEIEKYQFSGGYAQKFNQVTLGAQASYNAQLGARARDPRINNTTSELNLKIGLKYAFYRNFDVSLYAEGERYLQNSKVRFASKIGQSLVYQMTGFGFYNSLFSGGTTSLTTVHEEYGYKFGGGINHKEGKDFYILAYIGQSNMLKSYRGTSNRFYDLSDLNKDYFEVEGAKFFQIADHRLGVKLNYLSNQTTGKEYGYTNNTQLLEQIYKRLSYKRDETITSFSLLYSLNKDKFSLSALPYFRMQEIKEQRINPYSGQKIEYSIIGLIVDYKHKIANNQALTFRPFLDIKSVTSSKNALATIDLSFLNNWINQDYNYLASDIQTIGASLRYDIKVEKIPALFVETGFSNSRIQSKNNNFSTVMVGITF
ncbi:DUF6850 family outer membrane beta-barrel protein [Empedobacter falsenii]